LDIRAGAERWVGCRQPGAGTGRVRAGRILIEAWVLNERHKKWAGRFGFVSCLNLEISSLAAIVFAGLLC